jgi:hypothetical protein
MTNNTKKYVEVDLKAYQPFGLGLPILLFLAGIALTALLAVGIYEYLF